MTRSYATRNHTTGQRVGSGLHLALGDSTTDNDYLNPQSSTWPNLLGIKLNADYGIGWLWGYDEGSVPYRGSFLGGWSSGDIRNRYANWSRYLPTLVTINCVFNAHYNSVAFATLPWTVDPVTDVITCVGHTFGDGDVVRVRTDGLLPIADPIIHCGTAYYARDVSGDTLKLARTAGGAAIDFTTAGTGAHYAGGIYSPTGDAGDTVAEQAYIDDVSAVVDHFVAIGVPKSHILILMRAPGNINWANPHPQNAGEIAGAAKFARWNEGGGAFPDGVCTPTAHVTGGAQTSANGCVFVPMADVYGAGYDPITDPDDYIVGGLDDPNNLHPNVNGNLAWYNRIVNYLPTDLAPAANRAYSPRTYASRNYS